MDIIARVQELVDDEDEVKVTGGSEGRKTQRVKRKERKVGSDVRKRISNSQQRKDHLLKVKAGLTA